MEKTKKKGDIMFNQQFNQDTLSVRTQKTSLEEQIEALKKTLKHAVSGTVLVRIVWDNAHQVMNTYRTFFGVVTNHGDGGFSLHLGDGERFFNWENLRELEIINLKAVAKSLNALHGIVTT